MLKFTKGDSVKLVDPKSGLVDALQLDGWKVEEKKKATPKKKAKKNGDSK